MTIGGGPLDSGELIGLAASSFTSVSLEPALDTSSPLVFHRSGFGRLVEAG